MYIVVNYKKNCRYPETFNTFDEIWDYYNELDDPMAKIEFWDFETNTCKLVWTESYMDNVIAQKNKNYWTEVNYDFLKE